MKHTVTAACITLLIGVFPAASVAETHFIIDVRPFSVLSSPALDDNSTLEYGASWTPTLRTGIDVDFDHTVLTVTGGGGYLYNPRSGGGKDFSSSMFLADLALCLKIGRFVTIGPHLGVIHFGDPEYNESRNMELSSCTGGMVGLCATIGNRRVAFSGSIDYISASGDITSTDSTPLSDDEYDLSGVAAQLGVLVRL